MEIPYEVTPRRDTGLFNAKLGIWLFLASEVMLFGGLFSSYVFLRVGVDDGLDNPWPWGLNVQNEWLGFINTLVLIFSSVLVVFAWLAIKERNFRKYQILMYLVVGCAAVFMVIKGFEYKGKLTHHFGVKLNDNTVLEGELYNHGTNRIIFSGEKATFALQGGLPGFLKDLRGETPTFAVEGTDEKLKGADEVKSWFLKKRREYTQALVEERKRYRAEKAAQENWNGKGEAPPKPTTVGDGMKARNIASSATLVAEKPFEIHGHARSVVMHNDSSLSYKDGGIVNGKLVDDVIKFVPHQVDMQLVLPQNQRDSMAWKLDGMDYVKKQYFEQQKESYDELIDHYKDKPIPEKMLRGHILNFHEVHMHHDDHGDDHASTHEYTSEPTAPAAGKGEGKAGVDYVAIPRDQIKFMGFHGPRYNTYFAIYFTMTALHGLHVVGGALVLLFFTIFGKKLYQKNPEHLANRVEVGGLFWHFVDLVWIFLFPLMYLL